MAGSLCCKGAPLGWFALRLVPNYWAGTCELVDRTIACVLGWLVASQSGQQVA